MRIYVDELPKSCSWCPCFNSSNNTCKIDDSDVDCIPVDSYRVRFFNYTDKRHPICPLQSLSDYTKQVRKEVLDQVYKVFTTEDVWSELNSWWLVNGNCEELKTCLDAMVEETSVENIVKRFGQNKIFYQMLDQVQGETK